MKKQNMSLRVDEKTLNRARILASESKIAAPDVMRKALEIGTLILSTFGPSVQGRYGGVSPEQLAEEIRPYVLVSSNFFAQYGNVAHPTGEPMKATPTTNVEVDAGMGDMLEGFAEV